MALKAFCNIIIITETFGDKKTRVVSEYELSLYFVERNGFYDLGLRIAFRKGLTVLEDAEDDQFVAFDDDHGGGGDDVI